MREQLNALGGDLRLSGITPAHAGTTRGAKVSFPDRQDHPRSCGNNLHSFTGAYPSRGSPPLMREQLSEYSQKITKIRITPAHAGTTINSGHHLRAVGDHPRSCGNNLNVAVYSPISGGSPPLMREQRGRRRGDDAC